ncbi:MAG: hypothetical protein DHS20C15_20120 [Planctomycetota bacterium]|nr:MAG: hypothetical protein DHS20C15_20120 [Planctomycetota bacterium]
MSEPRGLDRFKELARAASREAPEPLDVRAAVLDRVAQSPPLEVGVLRETSLVAAAGFSLAAAAVALAAASPWISGIFDPMVQLLQSTQELVP